MPRKASSREKKQPGPGHCLIPGEPVRLGDIPTKSPLDSKKRDEAEAEFRSLRDELVEIQNRLYAEGRQSLLVVLQALDGGGKDGTIRNCFKGVNPQGVRVASFKVPSELERSHDYLWRIHAEVPRTGMIGVFNRSHYEDVLVVRVDELVAEERWQGRYEQINAFEKLLSDEGTRIVKFFLHISREEQQKRFQERLDQPEKQYKFAAADVTKSRQWDAYRLAYEDALTRCTTDHAPWYVIPADQKWYRNLAIMRVLVHTLREMNPQFPEPESGLTLDSDAQDG